MSELKPLPCPACGSENIHVASTRAMYVIACYDCSMAGPCSDAQEAAIPAWNSLPRALTWTTEPPKVEGFYWWKCEQEQPDAPLMVHADFFEGEFHYMFIYEDGPCFHECDKCHWAGPIPIPMPLEPEES